MFDTIRLKLENIHIKEDILKRVKDSTITTYYDRETGELNDRYQIREKDIPHIIYYSNSKKLLLQLSLPKFIFGENVSVVIPKTINLFWKKFEKRMKELFKIKVKKARWIIQRVDICWNFKVENKVSDYIELLGRKKLPYKNTYCINHSETVIYKNKSSSIMFYDKEKECKAKKQEKEVIERAKGLLRMEIQPPTKAIREHCAERKAISILTISFFKKIVGNVLNKISFKDSKLNGLDISYEWLSCEKLNRVETIIGFIAIQNSIGIAKTKEMYGSTYYSRNKWVNEINMPTAYQLAEIQIDWEELTSDK